MRELLRCIRLLSHSIGVLLVHFRHVHRVDEACLNGNSKEGHGRGEERRRTDVDVIEVDGFGGAIDCLK